MGRVLTLSLSDLDQVANRLASHLMPGDLLLLDGPMSAGKTTFVQALCRHLGVSNEVFSPTFTLVNQYHGRFTINHLDLYRLEQEQEVAALDLDLYLSNDMLTCIEWAQRMGRYTPTNHIRIQLELSGDPSTRLLSISGKGGRYETIIQVLSDFYR